MDQEQTVTGKSILRVDGPQKVRGEAKYAAEYNIPDLLHAYVVTASIAKGRILSIDLAAARRFPGVVEVLSHKNRPWFWPVSFLYKDAAGPPGKPFVPLDDDRVYFSGQPVALVIAENYEAARDAAALVKVTYKAEQHTTDLAASTAFKPRKRRIGVAPVPHPTGDADLAFAVAPLKIESTYTTSPENHHPMELFATTVKWGKIVTVYDKTQSPKSVELFLKVAFRLIGRKVRVVSTYVGGAFGLGLRPQQSVFLAVMAAKALERSVRLVLPRDHMFALGYRANAVQTVSLAADEQGRLQAVRHRAVAATSQFEDAQDPMLLFSASLYRCNNIKLTYELAKLDTVSPCDMRAPGAATGMFALESAMDELAYVLDMDPLALRLTNYTERDQSENRPFSSKALRECYALGSERFGWHKRSRAPRSMREDKELIGWGMATGAWEAAMSPAPARAKVMVRSDGKFEVTSSITDIGTGTYTILSQIAADTLETTMDRVVIRLGDSALPFNPIQGGSWTAATSGAAVQSACRKLKSTIRSRAKHTGVLGRGQGAELLSASALIDLLKLQRGRKLSATATMFSFPFGKKFSSATHAAVFAEVRVDEELSVVRVTRIVCAVAAGRILNPNTARSQIIGATVMGIGKALHEDAAYDHNLGRCMAHGFADYHIPTNADVYDIDVVFVDETDAEVSPLGVKGVGEIGVVAVAPAIANAIFHATGERMRHLPITIDRLARAGSR
ncbi:xanthine dehydrogenase family protein molybdopterin-binding subunit [Phyllobacterium sp. BT25]|uniref:Xanthine dehydrogenase family protein molybdopterin-binding subunit n=1 Tax=Phyllobacterium pellucidum TaxID=2740464 RepID=A0A849VU31_9HYPH|nr:xanthine dehydrogenase family protein molybdopterin-binding subunit [Phyllobacterium pellucidum]NTS33186.1 xanthine dehydrogenase family protein molybdopterin-binding subunit [Phyllobacterium pellucidum]